MSLGKFYTNFLYIFIAGLLAVYADRSSAEIIGTPPYKTIEIVTTPAAGHYDMVQGANNVIFVVFEKGIKIYNGSEWQVVEIPESHDLRTLYYDNEKRVYFGGRGTKGYIELDQFGEYQYTLIKEEESSQAEDIWGLLACNKHIYFQSTYQIFSFNPIDKSSKNWSFEEKLGAIICLNNELTIQDRKKGLLKLQKDNWLASDIKLENNALIYELEKTATNTIFILSDSEEWRIIKNNKVFSLNFGKQLPNLDNYVAIESLSDGKFVLGTNNGLLTFIDTNSMEAESFQMSNEWISKIVKTQDNGLLVLTEFEIFYLEWPTPLRTQGRESGLASATNDISGWNSKLYVSSSAGVFLEEKNQLVYQHKLFKRLNWTNKEAWNLLPINNKQALLAESHEIFLIENNSDITITPITTVIYPRKLIQSQYDPNVIYVITEFDVQTLQKTDEKTWYLNKILDYVPHSLIEQNSTTLLVSTAEHGLNRVTIKTSEEKVIEENNISNKLGLPMIRSNGLQFLRANDNSIYAFNHESVYKLNNGRFIEDPLFDLIPFLGKNILQDLFQSPEGLFYGYTATKLIYLNNENNWQLVDVSNYIKGQITTVKAIDNEIKIASHGSVITYLTNLLTPQDQPEFDLFISNVTFKNTDGTKKLPINPQQIFSFEQDEGEISFSFVLTDLKNQDKTQYRYRLSGSNQTWAHYIDKTHVSFNQLAAGEYTFEVQARDYLKRIYTIKGYPFTVKPHWYLTLYAKILWVILFILVIAFLVQLLIKWREKVHEAQKLELKQIIREKTTALKQANDSLQKMAHRDGLTGLFNRLYLDEYIESLIDKNINKIIVMMLDMDCFKKYNDNNGHVAGDELLKKLAKYLKNTINKSTDVVARYGGEEFVAILVNTTLDEALSKAEKIRSSIENKQNKIGISIGISESDENLSQKNANDIYHLIDQADQALYQAKRSGRNRIKTYDAQKEN